MTTNPVTGSLGPFGATHVTSHTEIPEDVIIAHREHFKITTLTLFAPGKRVVMNGYPRQKKQPGTVGTVLSYSYGTTYDGHPYITTYIKTDFGDVLPCAPECCYELTEEQA